MKHKKPPRLDSMQKRYTVRVGDDEDKRISEYCERTGRNRSDLFREAVGRMIDLEHSEKSSRGRDGADKED